MEIPKPEQEPEIQSQTKPQNSSTPSPSSSGRSSLLNSPEFEFWMFSNPSFEQPNLHSADELFVDGIILPLCLLSHEEQQQIHSSDENPQRNLEGEGENETPISEQGLKPEPELESSRGIGPDPGSGPESSSSSSAASTAVVSTSKRWRDIFKVGEKKSISNGNRNQEENKWGVEKEKRKDRKSSSTNNSSTAGGTSNSAELNINIWPFSRSRSAGNNGNRPKVPLTRKVSSAPCSRSNSGSESKSRKWPSSPSRGGGIHLGRSSPVWQVRRGLTTTTSTTGMNKNSSEPVVIKNADNDKKVSIVKKEGSESSRWSKSRLGGGSGGGGGGGGGNGASGLNLNVRMCMGYRQNSICRSDEHRSSLLVNGGGGEQSCSGGAVSNGGGNGVKMFNIRTLFSSKKVY